MKSILEKAKKKWSLWDQVNAIFELHDDPIIIEQKLFNLSKKAINNNN